jgi:C4-dicarboxylate transporter
MKKKFILPIVMLLATSGCFIHAFFANQSMLFSVLEIIFSVLATYLVFTAFPELCNNTEEDMERYTFLSITLTVFWWLLRATVIIFLIVIYFAVEGNDELAKQLLIGFVVSVVTFFTMSCTASWCIYHNGTVYPINRSPYYDDSDYEFDF